MTKEDLIRMAHEAGWQYAHGESGYEPLWAFAALVASHALVEPCCGNYDQCQKVCMPRAASAEREACIVDIQMHIPRSGRHTPEYQMAMRMLERIRARGQE